MKRSELLTAGVALGLTSCATKPSSGIALPQNAVRPLGTKGSCSYDVTQTEGRILASYSCGNGFWATGQVLMDPKSGYVNPAADLYWCKNPPSQCNFPNHLVWKFSWANDPDWDWLKKKLINLGNTGWQALPNGNNGGEMYHNGNLVGKAHINSFYNTLKLTSYLYNPSGDNYDIPIQLPSGSGLGPEYDCTADDLDCLAMIGTFAGLAFSAETGVGALLAAAAFVGMTAAAYRARKHGCF